MTRIFIASYPDNGFTEKIQAIQANNSHLSELWGRQCVFSKLEKLHLTYLFMGNVDKANLTKIKPTLLALIDKSQEEFIKGKALLKLDFDRLEFWPSASNPKTMVLRSFKTNETISALQSKIKLALFPFIEPKVRDQALQDFKPHITLARFYDEGKLGNVSVNKDSRQLPKTNPKSVLKPNANDIRLLRNTIPLELKLSHLSIVESDLKTKNYNELEKLPLITLSLA